MTMTTPKAAAVDEGMPTSEEHPAVRAWLSLYAVGGEVAGVDTITSKEKASVWRLRGVAPDGGDVIAKRARCETAVIERVMYEQVTPEAGVAVPDYFGCVEEPDGLWLFLADIGDEPFAHDEAEHRTLAARWLARLHTGVDAARYAHALPDRGPAHFRQRLTAAANTLQGRLAGGAEGEEREVITGLLDQCALLARRWPEIEAFCSRLPLAIVHGDFAALNLRLRRDGGSAKLVAFDFEKAGVGVPAIDMVRGLDLQAYWSEVHHRWPELTIDHVREMALIARIFRPLSHNWARKTPQKLYDHYVHMQQTIEALGWNSREGTIA